MVGRPLDVLILEDHIGLLSHSQECQRVGIFLETEEKEKKRLALHGLKEILHACYVKLLVGFGIRAAGGETRDFRFIVPGV